MLRQKQTAKTDSMSESMRIVVFGEFDGFDDDDQVVSYARFVSNSAAEGATALEVGRAMDSVSPDDIVNLQFTSGKLTMQRQFQNITARYLYPLQGQLELSKLPC